MKSRKRIEWTKLDNASKIFPSTSSNRDTKVYRLTCEMFEDVNPDILQLALNLTIESFPIYKSVLRRGFFWYYFEISNIPPVVEEETTPLCSPIYFKDRKNLLFRVIYYYKRINLEIFHALSDGAGAIWFMETLVFHYLMLAYKDEFQDTLPKLNYKASISQKMTDSFEKNYYKGKDSLLKRHNKKKQHPAYQIKGSRLDENRMKVIEGSVSVKSILGIAHEYNTTLTIFLTSLFLYSIYKDMPENKKFKPVVLSVPIDLRQYYNSTTARNFFSTMNISYDFEKNSSDFEDIIKSVDESFKENLTKEGISNKLARFMALESNPFARIIPLPIKDLSLRVANKINDRKITTSISNIGRITTSPEFEKYIKQFSICVSARRPQITLCSYKDRMVISFTSPYEETDIQRTFFQFLTSKGLEIEVASNYGKEV